MLYQIGDQIELTQEVRGVAIGTRGIVQSIDESTNALIMDLQQNDVVLPIDKPDEQIQKV